MYSLSLWWITPRAIRLIFTAANSYRNVMTYLLGDRIGLPKLRYEFLLNCIADKYSAKGNAFILTEFLEWDIFINILINVAEQHFTIYYASLRAGYMLVLKLLNAWQLHLNMRQNLYW